MLRSSFSVLKATRHAALKFSFRWGLLSSINLPAQSNTLLHIWSIKLKLLCATVRSTITSTIFTEERVTDWVMATWPPTNLEMSRKKRKKTSLIGESVLHSATIAQSKGGKGSHSYDETIPSWYQNKFRCDRCDESSKTWWTRTHTICLQPRPRADSNGVEQLVSSNEPKRGNFSL